MFFMIFLLVTFGCIYVVVESAIFIPVRVILASRHMLLETFMYCAYCVGFWVGVVVSSYWWEWHVHTPMAAIGSVLFRLFCGAAVMGSIAVLRTIRADFLMGAHDREREAIARFRDARDARGAAEESGGGDGDGDGDAGDLGPDGPVDREHAA